MIISYINGEWKEPGSLCQAIGIFKENFHKTVSVVGGGGKTTVIRRLMMNTGMPEFHVRFLQQLIYKNVMLDIFWENLRWKCSVRL